MTSHRQAAEEVRVEHLGHCNQCGLDFIAISAECPDCNRRDGKYACAE